MRIFLIYMYLRLKALITKVRLNIAIDESVLQRAKRYALKQEASVSSLVENYLEKIAATEEIPLHIRALGSLSQASPQSVETKKNDEYLEPRPSKYGF